MTSALPEPGSPRERILDAALATVAERKVSGTRMREIARRANMSQGHLNYYYPAKKELFLVLLEYMGKLFAEEREDWTRESSLDPRAKLRRFLVRQKELILQRGDLLRARQDFAVQANEDPKIAEGIRVLYASWRADISAVIAAGVEQGEFGERCAVSVPNLLMALMEGATMQHLIDPEGFDLDTYFELSAEMVLGLLCAPAASVDES